MIRPIQLKHVVIFVILKLILYDKCNICYVYVVLWNIVLTVILFISTLVGLRQFTVSIRYQYNCALFFTNNSDVLSYMRNIV